MNSSRPFPRVPNIEVEPPGPRSKEVLDRQSSLIYPGAQFDSNPFVATRKIDSGSVASGVGALSSARAHPAALPGGFARLAARQPPEYVRNL